MNFITQTNLIQTDAGTTDDPQPIDPVVVALFPAIMTDPQEALDQVVNQPQAQQRQLGVAQPDLTDDPGAYQLSYDISCYYRIDVKGIIPGGNLLIYYDIWANADSFNAGDPPVVRNSHMFSLNPMESMDQFIQNEVEDFIRRVSLSDQEGDLIDYTQTFTPLADNTDSHYRTDAVLSLHEKEVSL